MSLILFTLEDEGIYTINPAINGHDGLFEFLHQNDPKTFPCKTDLYSKSEIIKVFDEVITRQNLFEETNWEIIWLPFNLRSLFLRKVVLYSELVSIVDEHLTLCYRPVYINQSKEDGVIKASWTKSERFLPSVQRVLFYGGDREIDLDTDYKLSPELESCLYLMCQDRAIKEAPLPGWRMAEILGKYIASIPHILDETDCRFLHTKATLLEFICNANVIHQLQLPGILRSHCLEVVDVAGGVCPNCCNPL